MMNPPTSPHCQGPCPEEEEEDEEEEEEEDWLHLSIASMGSHDLPGSVGDRSQVLQGQQEKKKGRLKTKLVSTWNNVKYGWSLKPKFKSKLSKNSPVTMLGQSYLLSNRAERDCFRRAFSSVLWLTYRQGFPRLGGSSLTSDSGWGCMLRSAQMLLAQGLVLHLLPSDGVWLSALSPDQDSLGSLELPQPSPDSPSSSSSSSSGGQAGVGGLQHGGSDSSQRKLVSWFGDRPGAPYGLHQLVELGHAAGKKAGDWYGPSVVAHILRKAVAASAGVVPDLAVYVAQDGTVYKGDVLRLCEGRVLEDSNGAVPGPVSRGVLILVPARLGSDSLNPSYINCVKNLLGLPWCIGIMGGIPRHSLYFVGYQDEKLLYLDPHYCQRAVDTTQPCFPLKSFYCYSPKKMSFSQMDPSCTIGFYAKGWENFELLCSDVTNVLSSSTDRYPVFTFTEGHAHDSQGGLGEERVVEQEEEGGWVPLCSVSPIQAHTRLRSSSPSTSCSNMEDFVLL